MSKYVALILVFCLCVSFCQGMPMQSQPSQNNGNDKFIIRSGGYDDDLASEVMIAGFCLYMTWLVLKAVTS